MGLRKKKKSGGLIARAKTQSQKRKASRTATKDRRIAKRETNKAKRIDRRGVRQDLRSTQRDTRRTTRLNKRQAKKLERIYGDMDRDTIDNINNLKPYEEPMLEELQDMGIPVEDEEDTIEIATKYAMANDEIENPLEDDVYDDAYINEDEEFESHYDKEKRRGVATRLVKGALGGVFDSLGGFTDELKNKQSRGGQLTEGERKLVKASNEAEGYVAQKVKGDIMETITSMLPLLIVAIVVIYFVKKG